MPECERTGYSVKGRLLRLTYLLAFLVMAANLIFVIRDSMTFSLDKLPTGEKLYSIASPAGDKTLTVYCVNNSFGTAVRADVTSRDGVRNVYWQTGLDGVDSGWINNMVVDINGVELNVEAGAEYDCRLGYSIFREGSIEGQDVEGSADAE